MDWIELPPHELVLACAQPRASAAWSEFVRRYHGIITAAALRVARQWQCSSPDEIDDVIQDIYLHLCADDAKLLTSFRSPHPDTSKSPLPTSPMTISAIEGRKSEAPARPSEWTASNPPPRRT